MELFIVISVVACIALIAAVLQIVRYETELRRMAQFLNAQTEVSGARLTSNMRSTSILDLAHAINTQLDKRQRDEKAMRAKDRELRDGFAYLSHDIRTPLMGARGYLQLALEEEERDESLRYVKAVEERLGSLQTILDQLFLFTRVSSEGFALEEAEVSLAAVLSEVLVAHYPEFEERGWTPKVTIQDASGGESPEEGMAVSLVQADADALKRIFENLVVNMLKHGEGEPAITQQGARVCFTNRIARPAAMDTELLFERFYKGTDSANNTGSGLGLAIVAQLAEAMGAQVEAEIVYRQSSQSNGEATSLPESLPASNKGEEEDAGIPEITASVPGEEEKGAKSRSAYLQIALTFAQKE